VVLEQAGKMRCVDCGQPALNKRGNRTGSPSRCRDCYKAHLRKKEKEYRKKYPERFASIRRRTLLRTYDLTEFEYQELLKVQNYRCAICSTNSPGGRTKRFVIDHDHLTGRVRGLLCDCCNRGIGFFEDNPELLQLAGKYLTQGSSISGQEDSKHQAANAT
jgi:hypothetical protein